MTNKLFRSGLKLSLAVIALCIVVILISIQNYFNREQEERLRDELKLAEAGIKLNGLKYLSSLEKGGYRITLIDSTGVVIFDSIGKVNEMENHLHREEIRIALEKGIGKSQRVSATLLDKKTYLAKKLDDGKVLRVSVGVITIWGMALSLINEIASVLLLTLLLAIFLSSRLAKKMVSPINQINLDKPLSNDIYDELSPLLRRIHNQNRDIAKQMQVIQQKKEEFSQIMNCMSEGLVLLNEDRKIVSMNRAAESFFEVGEDGIGIEFFTLNRDYEVENAIHSAIKNGHSEIMVEKGERKYQFNISRLDSEKGLMGLAILLFDISEKFLAEQARREFSANVSHELKTPLQAIIGSAELLENGLVREGDISYFIGKIRKESSRLLSLIEDIIKLSRLDEGASFSFEPIPIISLVYDVADWLEEKAKKAEVEIHITNEKSALFANGNKNMIADIVYNLLENAIKYNKPGGKVRIWLLEEDGEVVLSIKDNGIGIPSDRIDRVFERFYCVDKSHSKKTGGTGLGLAIVKHAVSVLGGRIELKSEVGEGTEVIVFLPKVTQ